MRPIVARRRRPTPATRRAEPCKRRNALFSPVVAWKSQFNFVNPRLPTMSYFDLSASYHFRESVEVRGGVNNLLDKDPPIVTSELIAGGAANSYELYDGLGRQLFLALTVKF
jgi:outer membrane receptor protein involved in Fe transport